MKKNILLFACTLMFATHSFAQVRFGVRAGLNLANMAGKGFTNAAITPKTLASYHVGGIADFGITPNFSVETGLLLSGKGTKIEESTILGNVSISITPLYLEVPINALYKLDVGTTKLHFFGGPYLGFGVGGKFKATFLAETTSENIKFGTADDSDLKSLDYGLNLGLGVEIHNFLIRAQYGLGLANLDPKGQSAEETKNRVIGISLGYMFGGK